MGTALTDFEEPSDLPTSSINSGSNMPPSATGPGPAISPRKANLVVTSFIASIFLFADNLKQSESAGRTLWAYGEQGLTVWVPFPGPHKQLMSRDRSLDFDNEVYPVGFVSDLGIHLQYS